MLFGGQRQSPRGGEIERPGIARQLADDRCHLAAAQALLEREERILGFLADDVDEAVAEHLRQARPIGAPAEPQRIAILHPQQNAAVVSLCRLRPIRRSERIGGERKRGGRSARLARGTEHLAVVRPCQPRPPARCVGGQAGKP
ncbi:hypothetical protein A6F68_02068 [Tsuneonella dongtanensis]|uniref:Uncharacterized protein n=1 Tax=Tsuneonella dongtanensis TaxID=692370 RepID=A0A1B2AEJ2_9SPHN|nr:hypothetical protein A6F68_02068 [Tsuneonella dongtanensis]